MNEININDEIKNALVRLGNKLGEVLTALEKINDIINDLEPYQRYELLHPRKKPRGSMRRARQGRLSE